MAPLPAQRPEAAFESGTRRSETSRNVLDKIGNDGRDPLHGRHIATDKWICQQLKGG